MASADELYEKWKQHCPTEVGVDDFAKVLYHRLGKWTREVPGTADRFLVEHIALSCHPAFGGKPNAMFSVQSGRKVKGIWVMHLLKAIEAIDLFEKMLADKKEK